MHPLFQRSIKSLGQSVLVFKNSFNTEEKFYIDLFANQNGRIEVNTIINHKLNDNLGTMLFANGAFIPTKQDQNMDTSLLGIMNGGLLSLIQ